MLKVEVVRMITKTEHPKMDNLYSVLVERVRDLIPQTWKPRQVTEFFLSAAVGHAKSAGTMTLEEMKSHLVKISDKLSG